MNQTDQLLKEIQHLKAIILHISNLTPKKPAGSIPATATFLDGFQQGFISYRQDIKSYLNSLKQS